MAEMVSSFRREAIEDLALHWQTSLDTASLAKRPVYMSFRTAPEPDKRLNDFYLRSLANAIFSSAREWRTSARVLRIYRPIVIID